MTMPMPGRHLVFALVVLFLAIGRLHGADLPDPFRQRAEPWIGPAPEPVMEQVFWLEVSAPPDAVGEVVAPEGVKLLDKTRPGPHRTRTRLYFRASRGIQDGSIRARIKGRADATVPLRVLTYREDIERHIKQVPGIDPSARKGARSYYADDVVATAKANLRQYPQLAGQIKAPLDYDGMADEQLFASLPSWNVPRDCYSTWPCPKCGDRIYKFSGFYPWARSQAHPFKAQCRFTKTLYPSNDWLADDFTSGPYPDDGWSWDPGTGQRKDRAAWIAYYNHHCLWQSFGGKVHRLALRYLLFGDRAAAHRAGVLLCRMAYVYCGMNMRWQQVNPRYRGRRGRLLVDGNWERNNILVPVCRAYDAIFDHLDTDADLVRFLQAKDPTMKSPAHVKALIDTYLIQVFGWDWIRRELSGGNAGAREEDMAQFAVCADMGKVSDRWIEELFTHAYSSGLNKGGFDDETLINTMTREGPVWISGLGYAYGYVASKSDMAEILSRVTSPRWKARCNLYDPAVYPKFRAEFDTWDDFLVAGQFGPSYGDSGGLQGSRYARGIAAACRRAYERAYRRWPTDKLARAVYRLGKQPPALFEPDVWPQVEAQAKAAGPVPALGSRVVDGVGFVFLESRPDAADLHARAGAALRYGYARGHHHNDNLNVELFAKGLSLTPELGYPCWAHPMGNTGHVAHHNTGMIDRGNQYPGCISRGDLELFGTAPGISFCDVSAQPSGFPNRMYRRALCLVDAPEGNVFVLDVLRLAGGRQRTYCFHGPPHDEFGSSVDFGPKSAEPFPLHGIGRRLSNNVVEPQEGRADDDVWAEWKYQGKSTRLRIDLLGRKGRRYFTARCAKTDLPPMRYLFAEDERADAASEFVAVWQPHDGEPFVTKVERLPVSGHSQGEFEPVAVRVTMVGGRVDTFLYTHHPDAALRCGDIRFKGVFGYWSEQDGRFRSAWLVAGESLLCRGQGIANAAPSFEAKIASVDYPGRAITLDRDVPEASAGEGRLLYIRAGQHRTAYHVARVQGRTVELDHNAIVYRSSVMGFGPDHLVCELPPPIEAARGFRAGYYNGATLTGAGHSAHYRVVKAERDRIYVDRKPRQSDFPEADGRRVAMIYDMGPGDPVVLYGAAYLRRE